jgi:D-cysteine desulfhydrase
VLKTNIPKPIKLANLPIKIEKLERLSKKLGKNIYIKRDDQTRIEFLS